MPDDPAELDREINRIIPAIINDGLASLGEVDTEHISIALITLAMQAHYPHMNRQQIKRHLKKLVDYCCDNVTWMKKGRSN